MAPSLAAQRGDVPEVVREVIAVADRDRAAGRIEAAIAGYQEAIRLGPRVIQSYLDLGALYHQRGELAAALETFAAGIEQPGDDRDLLYNAAVVALELDRAEQSLTYIEQAVRAFPRRPDLYLFQGTVLRRLERHGDSRDALERGVALAPRDARLLFALGNAYHQLGDLDQAVDAYSKAIRRDGDHWRAHYNLGAVLFEVGRYREAQDAYEVALVTVDEALARGESVDPIHAQAYLNFGTILAEQAAWEGAAEAFGKAVALDPESAVGHFQRGNALFRGARHEPARQSLNRALALDAELPNAYLHLAEIEIAAGRCVDALGHLGGALRRLLEDGDRLRALWMAAECQQRVDDPTAAEASLRQILELDSGHRPALAALGRLLRRQDRPAEARPILERLLSADPDDITAALELASLARFESDRQRERELYMRVLDGQQERPELRPVRMRLAMLLVSEGDLDGARRQLDRVLSGRGGRNQDVAERAARTVYGVLLAAQGERRQALEQLRSVLQGAPDHPAATAAIALLDAQAGQADRAVERFKRAVGEDASAVTQANLGQMLWLADQRGEAVPAFERAARAAPDWVLPRLHLGEAALASGDVERARSELERARRLCGDTRNLRPPIGGEGIFQLPLSPVDGTAMCTTVDRRLAAVLVQQALAALAAGSDDTAQGLADRILALSRTAADRAIGHFVRGTARLAQGRDAAAGEDLQKAVDGGLPRPLMALAQNNLGIARYRQEEVAAARSLFLAAGDRVAPAQLNLGVLLEEYDGDTAGALSRFERYLEAGGARSAEVASWVDELRRFRP